MNLRVLGSNSKGNCYLLEGKEETLMIECGVNIKKIKQALNFDFSKVVGCVVSHEHLDHAVSIPDITRLGLNVYATAGTFNGFKSNRAKCITTQKEFQIGGFKILAFDVKHDAREPVGFLINHKECGDTLFLTDTFYSPYSFKNLNNIIIEANYSKAIIDRKMRQGENPEFLRNRILKSHLSLENCKGALKANDLSLVNNIVLIHLSDSNSDEVQFQREVYELTGKNVSVANVGMDIPFNKTSF